MAQLNDITSLTSTGVNSIFLNIKHICQQSGSCASDIILINNLNAACSSKNLQTLAIFQQCSEKLY
jgi:hypothetical protein